MPEPLHLTHNHGLGDSVLLSGLIRDIHRAYPGRFQISIRASFKGLFLGCDLRSQRKQPKGTKSYRITYQSAIRSSNRATNAAGRIHMLTAFHRNFERQSGIPVPVTAPYGDLRLTPEELANPLLGGRYWVIVAGGKRDFTVKHWDFVRWQIVIDQLLERGIRCVQVGAPHKNHVHATLKNSIDMLGQTENVRDLLSVVNGADGVICSVTGMMHIAAALQKPCVVLAGGAEPWWWEGYVNLDVPTRFGPQCAPVKVEHRYLHTLGQLHCCQSRGCWKKRVVPLDANDQTPSGRETLCQEPRRTPEGQPLGACMAMIHPAHVTDAVMSYYAEGTIPAISPKPPELPPAQLPRTASASPLLLPPAASFPRIDWEGPPQPSDASRTLPGAQGEPELVLPDMPAPQPALTPLEEPVLLRAPTDIARVKERNRELFAELNRKNPQPSSDVLDHHLIGGRITVFVCCYGQEPSHTQLAVRCIDSILRSVPEHRLDLRVGCNDVAPATLQYLETCPITKLYVSQQNMFKYPMMRQMFWDRDCPITTPLICWFDDDSYVVDNNWLSIAAEKVIETHPYDIRMWGMKFHHNLKLFQKRHGGDPVAWLKNRPWWKNRPLYNLQMKEAPNGQIIFFVVGGWWIMTTDAMRQGDIPCTSLRNNGGDILIGEQIHQAGYRICDFNRSTKPPKRDKIYVFSSGAPRRGVTHLFPWDPKDRT